MDNHTKTDVRRLLIGAAAIALLIGGAGVMLGRTLLAPTTIAAEAEDHGEEAGHVEGLVEMDGQRATDAGIATEVATVGSFGAEIIAQGVVEPALDGEAVLTARADGAVTRIAKRLGDPVRAGETIAWVESRDASAIAAERSSAQAGVTLARSAFDREKRLYEAKVTARQDFEVAQAALAQAEAELRRSQSAANAAKISSDGRTLAVTSLIAGRITRSDVRLGAYVTAGEELFRVADPRKIQVNASVLPADARRISAGDRAVIELIGGETVGATVRSATPGLDPESKVATLVLTPDGNGLLTPGQGLRVRITPRNAGAASGIGLPEEAIQTVEGREVVFVKGAKGFQATPVTVGQRSAGRVEIVAGLKPGSVVATKGAFLLKAEIGKGEAEH